MKKGEIYEGVVERIDFPNKGRVHVEGETVTVKNAIPGQKIRFMVNKKRGGKCEGRLLQVLENAPSETADRCKHFGTCGGCVYQSVQYEEQLKMKEAQVHKLLSEAVDGELNFEGIIGSPCQEAYRNKMEFSFGDEVKGGELALGLHKRNSMYDIVTVDGCKIVDEDYHKILTAVLEYCRKKELPYYHKMTHEGYLRHLLVRKAVKTQQILVDVVTTTQIEFDMAELAGILRELPLSGTLTGFLHTRNDSVADVVKNEGTTVLYGRDYIEEELLGQVDALLPQADVRSRNEFVNRALRFYIGYLTSEKIENYMLTTISSVMHATVKDSENRMARAMYKLAVETSKLSHVIAYSHGVDEQALGKLQAKCAEEVKRINGAVRFEEAYQYQQGDRF